MKLQGNLSLSKIGSLQKNATGDEITILEKAKIDILKKEYVLRDIEDVLPRTPGIVDTIFHFLLVWYYCTLTIRERILIANGSRIKGWWNISHFMSTAYSGIMLIWPRSRSYDEFRDQFMLFCLYLNLVHFIQFQYQISCLYKLRTLGCRHPMDITVAMGSIVTVLQVIRQKICAPPPIVLHDHLTKKYSFAVPNENFKAYDEFGDNDDTTTEKVIT
uniref:Transmembrane protein 120A n=1 Tax=Schistosoma haematobium TaxID=6185 RepID=A0A094ZU79_SCHHA